MAAGLMKALEGYDKLKTRTQNAAKLAKLETQRMYGAGAAILAAGVAGVADAKYRADDGTDKKVLGVPVVTAAAGLATLAGLSGWVPYGYYIGMAGVGALSYKIGTYTHNKQLEHQQNQGK